MLAELAWVAIRGSDGSILESRTRGGAVTCVRTATGTYTLTLSATAFRSLSVTQQTPGDPTATAPVDWLITTNASGTSTQLEGYTLAGVLTDSDFAVRFLG